MGVYVIPATTRHNGSLGSLLVRRFTGHQSPVPHSMIFLHATSPQHRVPRGHLQHNHLAASITLTRGDGFLVLKRNATSGPLRQGHRPAAASPPVCSPPRRSTTGAATGLFSGRVTPSSQRQIPPDPPPSPCGPVCVEFRQIAAFTSVDDDVASAGFSWPAPASPSIRRLLVCSEFATACRHHPHLQFTAGRTEPRRQARCWVWAHGVRLLCRCTAQYPEPGRFATGTDRRGRCH